MVGSPADRAVVERVLAEGKVDATIPPPDWSGYLVDLSHALVRFLVKLVAPVGTVLSGYGGVATAIVATLAALIAAWLLILAVRAGRGRRIGPSSAPDVRAEKAGARYDARGWREELERRLQTGAVGPSLEAFWWWFACSLTGRADVERSSTSRELVRVTGRGEWSEPARELDRWLYGPRRPAISELRTLLQRFEQAA